MKEFPVRKNIRLEGYDYSQSGAYFITIYVKDGHEMLGAISRDELCSSDYVLSNVYDDVSVPLLPSK